MIKNWKTYLPIIIASLLVIISIGMGKAQTSSFSLAFQPGQKVVQKTIDFINKNMLQGQTAVLGDVKAVSGVYEFKMTIGEQEYASYVTKDGKFLFTSGVDMSPATSTANNDSTVTNTTKPKQTCEDLTKTGAPILEAFVVSKCPFGLQMQRILAEIVKNIPEAAKYIKVEYIGAVSDNKVTAMHGNEEAQENLRQVCIREEQANKYWDYIACHIKKGDIDPCLTSAKIDKTILATCMKDTNKGIAYIKKDFERSDKFNATGSPALILNEKDVSEFDFGGRTAEAVKTVICCGFNNQPSFCSQKLTIDEAASSFSETYSSTSSSSPASSASCN
ncbi:MAG: hypothetical protein WC306_01740 [Candidatus Paceibacterota bacterium]|jgi:hypothetical protein